MKVCVCGGTNPGTDERFLGSVKEIAKLFCDNDVELVWGGNRFGVLSAFYNEYQKRKKPNTLILPKVYTDDLEHMETDKVIIVDTISQRMDAMAKLSDAIVFVPGGIGTVYEFWASVEGLRSGEYSAKLFLYNYESFFDPQIEFFNFINKHGFTKTGVGGSPYKIDPEKLFTVVTNPRELMNHVSYDC